jgi:hypothetical protein
MMAFLKVLAYLSELWLRVCDVAELVAQADHEQQIVTITQTNINDTLTFV